MEDHWSRLARRRLDYLQELAEPVALGVARKDTTHPVFCGCCDWHSAVHGAYELLAVSRHTGESGWLASLGPVLEGRKLALELDCLREGALDHELPYGYAWLLQLAIERQRVLDDTAMQPLAVEAATRLLRWLESLGPRALEASCLSREYGNLSWPILNLWKWASFNGDDLQRTSLRQLARDGLLPQGRLLAPSYDAVVRGFFPAALSRIRTLLVTLGGTGDQSYLREFLENEITLTPVSDPPTPHCAGLNFSRSWGLWALYRATGSKSYREAYAEHVLAQMERPRYWRHGYWHYSHWVPQFGVYALALSLDDDS